MVSSAIASVCRLFFLCYFFVALCVVISSHSRTCYCRAGPMLSWRLVVVWQWWCCCCCKPHVVSRLTSIDVVGVHVVVLFGWRVSQFCALLALQLASDSLHVSTRIFIFVYICTYSEQGAREMRRGEGLTDADDCTWESLCIDIIHEGYYCTYVHYTPPLYPLSSFLFVLYAGLLSMLACLFFFFFFLWLLREWCLLRRESMRVYVFRIPPQISNSGAPRGHKRERILPFSHWI